jgi:hypothetical protein
VIERNLPPVTCVRAVSVRGLRKARPARRRKAA